MKLFYFDVPGRAEQCRMVLKMGNVPFEDVRFKREEWAPKYKPLAPTGQCPWLELDDGCTLSDSKAIMMYGAARAGLIPKDPVELAFCEQAVCFMESVTPHLKAFYLPDGDKAQAKKDVIARLAVLSALIGKTQGPSGLVVGSNLTFADICLYCWCRKNYPMYDPAMGEEILRACPELRRVCEAVEKDPRVQAYNNSSK